MVKPRQHGISVVEHISGMRGAVTFGTEKAVWQTVTTANSSCVDVTLLTGVRGYVFFGC